MKRESCVTVINWLLDYESFFFILWMLIPVPRKKTKHKWVTETFYHTLIFIFPSFSCCLLWKLFILLFSFDNDLIFTYTTQTKVKRKVMFCALKKQILDPIVVCQQILCHWVWYKTYMQYIIQYAPKLIIKEAI